MKIKWYNKIQVRISIIFLVLTTVSLAAFCMYSYSSTKQAMHNELDRLTKATSARLASQLAHPMSLGDIKLVESLIESELIDVRISSLVVTGTDQSIFIGRERGPDGSITVSKGKNEDGFLSQTDTIVYDNKILGRVVLNVQANFMADELKQSAINLFLVATGLNIFIFLSLFFVLRKTIILPMIKLTKSTSDISLGRLEEAIAIRSKDEIGHLAEAIERMRVSIRLAIERLASSRKAMPGVDASEWSDVILEKKHYGFEFLALRILVGRLAVSYRNDPTPETMRSCIQQLIGFFQNEKNPQAQKDLKKIFGGVAA